MFSHHHGHSIPMSRMSPSFFMQRVSVMIYSTLHIYSARLCKHPELCGVVYATCIYNRCTPVPCNCNTTMTEFTSIEESAQKLHSYERTMELNLIELRKNPANLEAAHQRVSAYHSFPEEGLRWPPGPTQRDRYMKRMDELSSRLPSSDEE